MNDMNNFANFVTINNIDYEVNEPMFQELKDVNNFIKLLNKIQSENKLDLPIGFFNLMTAISFSWQEDVGLEGVLNIVSATFCDGARLEEVTYYEYF